MCRAAIVLLARAILQLLTHDSCASFLAEMLHRQQPWRGANPFAIAVQVGANGRRLATSATLAGTWWEAFLSACWASEQERPTAIELSRALGKLKRDLIRGVAIGDSAGLPWPCTTQDRSSSSSSSTLSAEATTPEPGVLVNEAKLVEYDSDSPQQR